MDKQLISAKQGMYLMLGFVVGTAALLVPSSAIIAAKQDAWLVPLLSSLPGLFLLYLLVSLHKMYPGQSLVQYSSSILGVTGKLVSLLMLWFFFHLGALVLRNIGNFVASTMLVETPVTVTYLFITALSVYCLRLGIEVLSRTFSILLLLVISLILFLHMYSMFFANYENLLPVLSFGIGPVLRATLSMATFPVGEIVLFAMIIGHVKDTRTTGYELSKGFLLGLFILLLLIERALVNLGPERAARSVYTIVSGTNAFTGGGLLLPILTLNVFVLTISKFIVCFYAFVTGIAHWAKISDYKPLVLPAGILIMIFAIYVYGNAVEEFSFASKIWPVYAFPFEYGIPLLLWLAAMVKKLIQSSSSKT